MVKRILKIVSIILASFVVIVGGAVGIVALTGGFEKEEINITKLYFDDDPTLINKQIRTLEDVVARIDFEPKNATNRELEIDVEGNENGIIAKLPDKLNAGEDFTIKVNKDDKGNNIGGVVTIKAKQGIAPVSLTIVVDVDIPDNALYFSSDSLGKLTLSGKNFTMPISTDTQYIYLKSNLVNAFHLQANNENMKSAVIGLTYYDKNGKKISAKSIDKIEGLTPDSEYNPIEKRLNYFYKIPVVTDEAGTIEIVAKAHRTSEIEEAFKEGGFENLEVTMANGGDIATLTLAKYNDFLNKYINYFDNTLESYQFFQNRISTTTGKITLGSTSDIIKSLEFVYVSCKATIDITAIKLDDFTSVADHATEFNVFTDTFMSISGTNALNLIDTFNLSITTNNEEVDDAQDEKEYLFSKSLNLGTYLYLSAGTEEYSTFAPEDFVTIDDVEMISWQGKTYKYIEVYGFNQHSPITTIEGAIEKYGEGYTPIAQGYLLQLVDQDEYVSITKLYRNNETQWKLSCNVPLPTDQNPVGENGENIFKALYLGFEVSGIDSENNEYITKNSFSRIYVNYDDYVFDSPDVDNLAFNEVNENMAINTSIVDANELDASNHVTVDLPDKICTQDISIDFSNVSYGDGTGNPTPSYTSIMYFAESTSNTVDDVYKKIATVGKYKFINFTNANQSSATSASYLKYDNADLIGERIATYTTKNVNGTTTKNYYIHALNASSEPVRLFAVAYLSDAQGNPIDINGRKLNISDEANLTDKNAIPLVIIRISDFQNNDLMPSIKINNYVDNMNFYTDSLKSNTVGDVDFSTGFLNRNVVNYYETEDGTLVDGSDLAEIQNYLVMKLLKDNSFTLYISNFDLDKSKSIMPVEDKLSESIAGITYAINVNGNKQIAFNNLCRDFSNYSLELGNEGCNLKEEPVILDANGEVWVKSDDEESATDALMIKFVITSNTIFTSPQRIYLDPTNSTIPYSLNLKQTVSNDSSSTGQQQRLNCAEYVTNELIVDDVNILNASTGLSMQNKLFASFNDDSNNPGLDFKRHNIAGGVLDMSPYYFPLQVSDISSSNGTSTKLQHIWFEVYNNLIIGNDLNLSLIDCSQADERTDIDVTVDGECYKTIEEYVKHYVGPGATQIKYTNPESVMSFENDWTFNNLVGDGYTNYIYFGSNAFQIDNSQVNINGYILDLESNNHASGTEYIFRISKDQYFPVVASGEFALIYNELFEIRRDADVPYIYDYVGDDRSSGTPINIKMSAQLLLEDGSTPNYDADKYMDDSDANYGALTIATNVSSGANTANGTLNFKHGDILAQYVDNGMGGQILQEIYEIDEDGEYIKNENGVYVKTDLSDSTFPRYSKKGVIVYLLVTFNLKPNTAGDFEKTVYKAIEYQLVQEDIEITGYNEGSQLNGSEDANRYEVTAGSDVEITLNGQSGPRIVANDNNFFTHVKISHNATTIEGVSCDIEGGKIKLTLPNLVEDKRLSIKLTYNDFKSSDNKTFEYYIYVHRNVAIDYNAENVELKTLPIAGLPSDNGIKVYVIELESGDYNIYGATDGSDIISQYFTIGSSNIKNVKLVKKKNSTGSSIINDGYSVINDQDNKLTLNTCYATYDGTSITKDFAIFDVVVWLNESGTNTITLQTPLYVRITPTYIVDTTALKDISIYNGDSIFVDYLKLYSGNTTDVQIKNGQGLIKEDSTYAQLFKLTTKNSADSTNLQINNTYGTLIYEGTLTQDKSIPLVLSYNEVGIDINYEFEVTIKYVGILTTDKVTNEPGVIDSNIVIECNAGDKIVVSDYLTLSVEDNVNNISPVLVRTDTETGEKTIYASIDVTQISSGETFEIGYAKFINDEPELVETISYTFTINIAESTTNE